MNSLHRNGSRTLGSRTVVVCATVGLAGLALWTGACSDSDDPVAPLPVLDGGLDARADAKLDAGSDTAAKDSGQGDTTTQPDVGVQDVSQPDAKVDTGTPDTGKPDVGTPDSSTDSSTSDASDGSASTDAADANTCCDVTFAYKPAAVLTSAHLMGAPYPLDWSTGIPMTQLGNDWVVTVCLPLNTEFAYKFRLDGNTWVADPLNPSVLPDGMGGDNSRFAPMTQCPSPEAGTDAALDAPSADGETDAASDVVVADATGDAAEEASTGDAGPSDAGTSDAEPAADAQAD